MDDVELSAEMLILNSYWGQILNPGKICFNHGVETFK
jgi:hypothetical protein